MLRKKGKHPKKENGEPRTHKQLDQHHAKSLRLIRGIYNSWKKSPKFLLRLDANLEKRMYLSKTNSVTANKDEARRFAVGFDNEEVKADYWSKRLRLKFIVERAE